MSASLQAKAAHRLCTWSERGWTAQTEILDSAGRVSLGVDGGGVSLRSVVWNWSYHIALYSVREDSTGSVTRTFLKSSKG